MMAFTPTMTWKSQVAILTLQNRMKASKVILAILTSTMAIFISLQAMMGLILLLVEIPAVVLVEVEKVRLLPGKYVLNIAGGYLVVNAQGDGLDSNDQLTISGGTQLVNGPYRKTEMEP